LNPAEASLAHLEAVGARLAETHQELQKEVDTLQAELRVSQDPERMSVIQEMISVPMNLSSFRDPNLIRRSLLGSAWTNVPHQGKGHRVGGCGTGHHEGYPSAGPGKEEPYYEHDHNEAIADAGCVNFRLHFQLLASYLSSFSQCVDSARGFDQGEEI